MARPPIASGSSPWPHSESGRLAVSTCIIAVIIVVTGILLGGSWAFAVFLGMLGMVAALGLSLVAIIRHHERSLAIYLPLAIGLLAMLFFAVEILAGHD